MFKIRLRRVLRVFCRLSGCGGLGGGRRREGTLLDLRCGSHFTSVGKAMQVSREGN